MVFPLQNFPHIPPPTFDFANASSNFGGSAVAHFCERRRTSVFVLNLVIRSKLGEGVENSSTKVQIRRGGKDFSLLLGRRWVLLWPKDTVLASQSSEGLLPRRHE